MNRFFLFQHSLVLCVAMLGGRTAYANNPDLVYNPETGNVVLVPDGALIIGFNLQSAGRFNPVLDTADLEASTYGIPGFTDNSPEAIGWVLGIEGGFGDRLEDQVGANLGNIFPVGLTQESLDDLLTVNAWSGAMGTSGSFELFGGLAVPEPASCMLLLLGWSGLFSRVKALANTKRNQGKVLMT